MVRSRNVANEQLGNFGFMRYYKTEEGIMTDRRFCSTGISRIFLICLVLLIPGAMLNAAGNEPVTPIHDLGKAGAETGDPIAVEAGQILTNLVYNDVVSNIEPDTPQDTLFVGGNYAIRVHIENAWLLGGLSLGYHLYTADGITWSWTAQPGGYPVGGYEAVTVIPGSRLDPPENSLDMTGLVVTEKDMDGISPDTIMVGGVAMMRGLSSGPLEPMYQMHFKIEDMTADFGILCIDSAFVPPSGIFCFVDMFDAYYPKFYGPFCWPVKRIKPGDMDLDGQITVGDPVEMVAVIFKGKPHIAPLEAGDVNCDGSFDVGDVIYMINFIFKYGPPPGC